MSGIKIIATGRALPQGRISNDDLTQLVETDDEWITTRTGIKNRYKCNEETSLSLAVKAAQNALCNSGIDRNLIGAVIVATSTSEYIFPSTACLVAKELGLSKEIVAFDLSSACTGFLHGLMVSKGLVNSMERPYVLLVGAEQMSRIVDYTDRGTCILFGDGAGAAVLGPDECEYFQKNWADGNKDVLYCEGAGKESLVRMKGNDVFKFAVTVLEQGIREILEMAKLSFEDIDYVVCHQANKRIIEHVKKKFPEYSHKFFMNIENYGNTSAASIPIALDELLTGKEKGVKLLLVGFGAGLTWSASIINY